MVKDREPDMLHSMGLQSIGHDSVTEQQNINSYFLSFHKSISNLIIPLWLHIGPIFFVVAFYIHFVYFFFQQPWNVHQASVI